MVTLNRIYTKTGDAGETALGDGSRRPKYDLRIAAYGTVDEANCAVGLARLHTAGELDAMLSRIQNDLFDLGADLCARGGRAARRRPPAHRRIPGRKAGARDRRDEREPQAADVLHPAGRLARGGASASGARHRAARRKADRGTGAGGKDRRGSRSATSTGCRIICSWQAASPMTAAPGTYFGFPERTVRRRRRRGGRR